MELARQSVVRVRNTGCGELSVGSAWLADDGRLVSNQHVVEGLRGLEMSTWDGRDMTVASIEAADAADVSRVVATWPPAAVLRPMSIRTTRVEPGERIAILGYPEGGELAVSTGVSMGYATDLELAPREILKLTNVVKPGNSGGPAVDQLGRVVGVVYAEEIKTDAALVVPITDAIGPTAVPMQPVLPCS
jgi:S1-C subfamily serine protease